MTFVFENVQNKPKSVPFSIMLSSGYLQKRSVFTHNGIAYVVDRINRIDIKGDQVRVEGRWHVKTKETRNKNGR